MITESGMSIDESRIRTEHLRPCEAAIFAALRSLLWDDAYALALHRDAILDVIARGGTVDDVPPLSAAAHRPPASTLDLATPQDGRRVQSAILSVSVGGETTVRLSTGPLRVVVHPGANGHEAPHDAVSER